MDKLKIIIIYFVIFFNFIDSSQLFCLECPIHNDCTISVELLFHNNEETHTHSKSPVSNDPFHKLIHQSQINNDTSIFFFIGLSLISDDLKFYTSNCIGIINNNEMFYNIISPKAFIINSSLLI